MSMELYQSAGCNVFLRILRRLIITKLVSFHFTLIIVCVLYMIIGAWIFQALEGRHLKDMKAAQLRLIDLSVEKYVDRIWDLANSAKYQKIGRSKLKDLFRQNSKEQFFKYVDTVFTAHLKHRHGYDMTAPSWDFITSFFFTATMLTSIGYGYVAPLTFCGRLFGVIYCLIGIPLTLVTVANVAKFISECAFLIHYNCWKKLMTWKERRKGFTYRRNIFGDDDNEQELLDKIKLVRFPPIILFLLVFFYGLFGSYIIQKKEHWTYTESVYFTFISILTVGFGDYRPEHKNMMVVLCVIMGGIILTTMCMDVVGRMYIKEIHYIGRKIQTNNPFFLIREAKAKRRRQATASILLELARGMIFEPKDRRMITDDEYMFARLPPDPPRECQVVSTSAYSVRLAWEPAFSADDQVTYNIRYRIKHQENSRARELRGIQGHTAEIMSVDSCSLYEFRITAVSRFGESKPIYLVQYTEPQLSPQHILARRLNANTIELSWEPPYKRTTDVTNYIVYYTENPNAHFSVWERITVRGRRIVFPDLRYDWFYTFCATACFKDGQRSPLSRALFIKTDKLEFRPKCVGQSRTIEVMNTILYSEEELNERAPLLPRDYVSFQN
ncbi:TWiK family of potassium channels protein 7 [Dirofilaria immitis]|nr:TWiK family of potassium channels protein 7 [Dirofilaria immitis]